MYQDKLANLKNQLEELKNGIHPEYIRRVKKLDYQFRERIRLNEINRDYLVNCVEREYILEKNAAVKEYEEKKIDLKENLLTDFEDKRKIIETERHTMELTSDTMDIKPTITRKLRRRPNDPLPVVEKRPRKTNGSLVLLLEDKEVENDLKLISRGKVMTPIRSLGAGNGGNNPGNGIPSSPHSSNINLELQQQQQQQLQLQQQQLVETKIEDGKLLYERRWFHRGQPVFVEGNNIQRFSANISAIGNETIWVKKTSDNGKVKIYMSQLSRGKISIKRRAS
jgi:Sin3 histone deacetylase corepressor complex component SDS3